MTAVALNIQQPGRQDLGLRVRYVGAGQVSSGPFVVSVHPIGASTWAAVARGPDGRCYGTLVTGTGPYDFQTFYAEFPAGTPCKAEDRHHEHGDQHLVPGVAMTCSPAVPSSRCC